MPDAAEAELVARRLGAGDIEAALGLCRIDDIDRDVVARELAARADYCWMGLHAPDGTLAALHRGMRWHGHLLLKGVFVDDRFKQSAAGLRVAYAIRNWAMREGFEGVLAWVEPNKPESHLAHRLRIRATGPLLHRFLIPLPPTASTGAVPGVARMAGILTVAAPSQTPPAISELLRIEQDDQGCLCLAWILDRSRIVLSGNPCGDVADLDGLVHAVQPLAALTGATGLEIPFEAADLQTALRLAGTGARRLSRSPVRLGVGSFPSAMPSARAGRPAWLTSKAMYA